VPSYFCSAMLSALMDSRSRWFVGSSRTRKFGFCSMGLQKISLGDSLPEKKLLDFRTYFNNHRTHASLEGRTPALPVSRLVANLRSFRWQPHC